jgi:hypothetical protein
MVFKHFWTPFPFPVAKFRNFLPKSACFFQKNMVFKHFWTPFPFPVANFHFQTPFSPTFCHYNAQNMRNLEKKMLTSGEKSIHFRFLFFRF